MPESEPSETRRGEDRQRSSSRVMRRFRAKINGANFLFQLEGKIAKHGFYTFRDVEAADAEAAEIAAVQVLREDQKLRSLVQNAPEDRPTLAVEEIWEIDEREEHPPTGFIFYLMEPAKRWWQFWKR